MKGVRFMSVDSGKVEKKAKEPVDFLSFSYHVSNQPAQ